MSKIRKKQLFANDTTREGMLLFKAKTAKQFDGALSMLSLEPELHEALQVCGKALFSRGHHGSH